MPQAISCLTTHRLSLKLQPALVGELFLANKLIHPVYIYRDGMFVEIFKSGETIAKAAVQELLQNQVREIFLTNDDLDVIKQNLEHTLIQITRSVSVGNPLENGDRHLKLLAMNLNELYKNPHSDQLLMVQFQSTQNYSKFLIENKKYLPQFYQSMQEDNATHFTIQQPLMSSLLLLGFLQHTHLFHDREIETLFLTSFFKDVGLGLIPESKYDVKGLTHDEKELFSQHAQFSFDILENRIPISKTYLSIIKHHHFLNHRLSKILNEEKAKSREEDMMVGLESTMVAIMDILVAMTSNRPYRKPLSHFQALELIKRMIADDYPQEFKALVIYLRQFFKN